MKNLRKILTLVSLVVFAVSCSKDSDTPDDNTPTTAKVKISATNTVVEEPSSNGLYTISLTTAVSSSTTVNFTISGTATNGTDYQTISSSVNIAANTTSTTIPLNVLEDTNMEDTETVIITLTNTNNGNVTLGSPSTASISILDNTEEFVLQPEDTASYMVNPNSTPETIALFYNLKIQSDTKFIIGQQDAFNSFYNNNVGDSDIKKTTGSDPGLLGSDFMFITDDNNNGESSNWFFQQEEIIKADVIEAYDKGMVNVFAWHLREPYEGDEFYTENMTEFQQNNAFISILPGGENHDYYKLKLDKVAEVANSLVGNDGNKIPFIFRPFHEFDGNWFWWGAAWCSPSQYIELWRFTVEYLRDTKNVNNILFAFSPDNSFSNESGYLNRYPGDNYVDILGMDNYGDFNNQGQTGVDNANQKLQVVSNLAIEKVKIAALSETGYFVTPGQNNPISSFYANNLYNAMTENDVKIGFMMFWTNTQDTYCTPIPGLSSTSDFIEFTNKPKSLLQNGLPDMYTLPN